jgi:hypothetical protein
LVDQDVLDSQNPVTDALVDFAHPLAAHNIDRPRLAFSSDG